MPDIKNLLIGALKGTSFDASGWGGAPQHREGTWAIE